MNPFNRHTFLRNEEGGSPGGGAAPPPVPASPAAPAGAAPAPSPAFDPSVIKTTVVEAFAELRNGLFADLRKAGALKQDKPNDPAPQPAPGAAPAAGISMADVKRMLDVRTASERMRHERKASDAQLRRFELAVEYEKPDDVLSFAASYFDDLGIGKAAATVNPQPNVTTAPAAPAAPAPPLPSHNVSDRGPPSAGDIRDVDSILETDPLGLTKNDIERLKAKHGDSKAREMLQRSINAKLRGLKPTR